MYLLAAYSGWESSGANLKLAVEASGCCGMSGAYGHEARNQETSRTIFNQSWQKKLEEGPVQGRLPLATHVVVR